VKTADLYRATNLSPNFPECTKPGTKFQIIYRVTPTDHIHWGSAPRTRREGRKGKGTEGGRGRRRGERREEKG